MPHIAKDQGRARDLTGDQFRAPQKGDGQGDQSGADQQALNVVKERVPLGWGG